MHAFALAMLLAAPPEKVPATLDEKIAAALKTHPDIRAAEAKKLLAEAELEQARLVITQKVSAAASRVELAKVKLIQAEQDVKIAERLESAPPGTVSEAEKIQFFKAKPALIGVKAELAAAELELQLLVGKGGGSDPKVELKDPQIGVSPFNPNPKLPSGPVSERLETAVRMAFKLDLKDMEVKTAFEGLKTFGGDTLKSPPKFDKLSGQNSLDGWVQLFVDELNANQSGLPEQMQGKYDVYVREYGLLVERVANAPSDAMTLTQFARAVRAKK
jgi:hypothetical protein